MFHVLCFRSRDFSRDFRISLEICWVFPGDFRLFRETSGFCGIFELFLMISGCFQFLFTSFQFVSRDVGIFWETSGDVGRFLDVSGVFSGFVCRPSPSHPAVQPPPGQPAVVLAEQLTLPPGRPLFSRLWQYFSTV